MQYKIGSKLYIEGRLYIQCAAVNGELSAKRVRDYKWIILASTRKVDLSSTNLREHRCRKSARAQLEMVTGNRIGVFQNADQNPFQHTRFGS
jgi:hypothetical protein